MSVCCSKNELLIKKLKARVVSKIPMFAGLYLVGNTAFNPYTDEKFYFLKVGMSLKCIKERLKAYFTCNPILWKADYYECSDKKMTRFLEEQCQLVLLEKCLEICEGSTEWFRVDRETYLEICEKGFDYFQMSNLKDKFVLIKKA